MRKIKNFRDRIQNKNPGALSSSRRASNLSHKSQTAYIRADIHKCKACWTCLDSCPGQVFGKVSFLLHKHIIIKNHESCIGCKRCIKVCAHGVFTDITEIK